VDDRRREKKKTVITDAVGREYHGELEDNSDDERKMMRLSLRKEGRTKGGSEQAVS
jgi:hypothetical protein